MKASIIQVENSQLVLRDVLVNHTDFVSALVLQDEEEDAGARDELISCLTCFCSLQSDATNLSHQTHIYLSKQEYKMRKDSTPVKRFYIVVISQ